MTEPDYAHLPSDRRKQLTEGSGAVSGSWSPFTPVTAPGSEPAEAWSNPDVARYPDRALIGLARNIVNQILDESGADVPTRQRINDGCDEFVHGLLARRDEEVREQIAQAIEAMPLGRPVERFGAVMDWEEFDAAHVRMHAASLARAVPTAPDKDGA